MPGQRDLYCAVGHGHLGWTLACGSAKALADLMIDKKLDVKIDGAGLDRF